MHDPENDRREIAARRRARKQAKRADKARRAAAIEDAWMSWMYQLTPAEAAETAPERSAASAPADIPATPDAVTVEWPADLPRPGEGRRFPSVRRLARWLGVRERNFAPDEVTSMVSAWAVAAQAAGLQVNVSVEPDTPPSRSSVRPERPDKASR